MKLLLATTLAVAASAQFYGAYNGFTSAYPSYGYGYGAPATTGYNYGTARATNPVVPATTAATAPVAYNYGARYSAPYTGYATPYSGYATPYAPFRQYSSWVAPTQTCADRAVAGYRAEQDPENPNANYDGRKIIWNMIPEKTIVSNAAENAQASTGFASVATWNPAPINIETVGSRVMFNVDWEGSKSNINGNVVPKDFSQTYHVFDCNTSTENVYGDFGGMFKFMGVP
mmetsp:Transcript_43194/g.84662  ORF Transcript_43194/g.84662 Transcript_43194/m.84662 type:complete len:230 (+) Transcript_43194:33-722(+)